MWPPTGAPLKSNCTSMYFPNRLELSLRRVLAFPKASNTGLLCNRRSRTAPPRSGAGQVSA